jgi:hypothetical protein
MMEAFFYEHDRRSTLVLNIAIYDYALSAMQDVLRGHHDFLFNAVVHWGADDGMMTYSRIVCHLISLMLPFRNEDLVKHMRSLYPSLEELDLLGPMLTGKVILMAPFFPWVPPQRDGDDGTWFNDLPIPLEEMNETVIREFKMECWLQPHGGIAY